MKKMLVALLVWASLVQGAWAQTIEDRLLAGLQAQGFVILEKGITFFGRLRILAINETTQRGIVINPETGEILRDYTVLLALTNANPLQQQAGKSPQSPAKKPSPNANDTNQDIVASRNYANSGTPTIEADPPEDNPTIKGKAGTVDDIVVFPPSPLGTP